MERFRIHGPARLHGSLRSSGAKNASLPALAASLLTEQPVTLFGVPRVRDTHTMLRLLERLGRRHRESTDDRGRRLTLEAQPLPGEREAPYELVKTMRASVLVLGPLVARYGYARVSLPGGCAIGVRPIDQHLAGLEALGATVELRHGYVEARAERLRGADFELSTPTVTGTENLMMAACLASGATRLRNCAREPEIVDLADLLRAMGARIAGDGQSTIEIEGVPELSGAEHRVLFDRIESGTYLFGAAMTHGDVRVQGARAAALGVVLDVLAECGAEISTSSDADEEPWIRARCAGALRAYSLATAPFPGFPTDLQAQFLALATQAEGRSRVLETVFENRFQHVPELTRMGADIQVEGARATVRGPTRLSGATVMATDLRASACLVLAALCAHGETFVDRIYHLDRGYEAMESKLQLLGAVVERVG